MAVTGWYNDKEGKWRVDILSQHQECGNPSEVKRLKAQHFDQDNIVLKESFTPRLLGNMQPSRAFGDDALKLTKADKQSIELAGQVKFVGEESPFTKKTVPYIDPPFMDAEPEITIRKLRGNDNEKLKFLVIATDGSEDLPGTTPENSRGRCLFEDKNSAAHLIRNRLDGDGDKKVQEMILSLGGGAARSVRDDTSVM
ncbi:hypothetical protein L486_07670 [Kwoniella mangroviensis CBS 10435]|uniref:PPM-type phosphatase domain-containing protein n=1 Tax=Kwoniella mangroviensis CBS 10435 TaxID=1331196 RepID=A0A1B9II03_9TREE|nr:hypothetical protein L486_07670 [Kwoniella mangroviensis CBS 10435]